MTAEDVRAEENAIKDADVLSQLRLLMATAGANGEVWEWAWQADQRVDFQASYSLGWCVIRDGEIVDSFCHSAS